MRNLWILALCFWFKGVVATPLVIAVASNFQSPLKELVNVFQKQHQVEVSVVSAATGTLTNQIIHGAPYDLLFAADQKSPTYLIKLGLAVESSAFTYAIGQLALWSKKPIVNNGVLKLNPADFKTLAIANPKLAPYGLATYQALNNLDLVKLLAATIITTNNISEVYHLVMSDNVDLGFVAYSDLKFNQQTKNFWLVPTNLYSPIKQDVVILKTGKNSALAGLFLKFIKTKKAKMIITSYGYKNAN